MDTDMKEPETVGALVDRLPVPRTGEVSPASAVAPPASSAEQEATLLGAIVNASRDPSIDVAKLKALMDMQERLEQRQAEREFAAAYARLSGKLPQVKKDGSIELIDRTGVNKGTVKFAKWEDMDRVIRPVMAEEGFTLDFTSAMRQAEGGGFVIIGTLTHRDGHSRKAEMALPLDTGPGRNNLQAAGSTLSYGKRYCAEMLLNIVRKGADDDGKKGGDESISDAQKTELVALMKDAAELVDPAKLTARFNKRFKIETLDDLRTSQFTDAKGALVEVINVNSKNKVP